MIPAIPVSACVALLVITTVEVLRKSGPSLSSASIQTSGKVSRDSIFDETKISTTEPRTESNIAGVVEDSVVKTSRNPETNIFRESSTAGDSKDSIVSTSRKPETKVSKQSISDILKELKAFTSRKSSLGETDEARSEVVTEGRPATGRSTHLQRAATARSTVQEEQTRQPHLVFVLADDYGHSDIGYHGSWINTPVMDRMAAEGVKLENYYVQPICTPTRSQLLSGRYQIHTGMQHDIIGPSQPNGLPLDSPTLADKLKESGYSTHMVGKWHLGFFKREYMPHYRGFDSFYGMLLGSGNHFTHKHGRNKHSFLDLRFNDQIVRNESGHYSTHLFTEKAIDRIRAHDKSKPLFLYLSYQAVHGPVQVPDSYTRPYKHIKNKKRRGYAGMVTAMDEGIGNLTDALKEAGMWDNTVFVFSSDNGGRVGNGASNYPLKGEKHSLWEGGVKSIGFVSGGRLKQAGAVSKDLIHVSDWFPTFVGLAGGHLNGTKPLDGVDQWGTINEGKAGKRQVLLHNIDPLYTRRGVAKVKDTFDSSIRAAVRVGDLKLITGDPGKGQWLPPLGSTIKETKRWNKRGRKNLWLYNITADPNERSDLSGQRPGDVRRMLDILQEFQETAVEPRYPRSDKRYTPANHGGAWGPWL